MDVEHPMLERLHHGGWDLLEVARESHEIGAVLGKCIEQCFGKGAFAREVGRRKHSYRYLGALGFFDSADVHAVCNEQDRFGIEAPGGDGFEHRAEVGATPGGENSEGGARRSGPAQQGGGRE